MSQHVHRISTPGPKIESIGLLAAVDQSKPHGFPEPEEKKACSGGDLFAPLPRGAIDHGYFGVLNPPVITLSGFTRLSLAL